MKVLWITPKWTLPANDGARVATMRLLEGLKKTPMEIDYLALSHPDDLESKEEIIKMFQLNSAEFVKRKIPFDQFDKVLFYLKALGKNPFLPLTLSSFDAKDIIHKMELYNLNEYNYIIIDGLHCAEALKKLNVDSKLVYRSHNVESEIWRSACRVERNLIKKVFLFFQYKLMLNYEKNVLRKAKYVLPISNDDKKIYLKDISEKKLHTTPVGMEFRTGGLRAESTKNHFLFIGRLDWPPNRDGLKWFLDNVWSEVDKKKSHLHIVGSGDKEWLKAYTHIKSITQHGYIEDIGDLYDRVDCSLIPIFYGSGTRIKLIESIAFNKPIISTKMGALGSTLVEGESYFGCETASEWVSKINTFDIDDSKKVLENARKALIVDFDQTKIAEKLYDFLK